MQTIEGNVTARGKRFAVIVSRFNHLVCEKLLQGAEDCLKRHEAEDEAISVYYVPGSFEIPVVAKRLSRKKDIDAVICLGAVIRGGTPHFDYVAAEVSKGIANVSLESEKPVIYGVLTTDTIEQALERAGTKAGNRGWDAAMSAMEMVNLFDEIDR
jgi:6,7-dimethyl-8-ribityllumazine synthase